MEKRILFAIIASIIQLVMIPVLYWGL